MKVKRKNIPDCKRRVAQGMTGAGGVCPWIRRAQANEFNSLGVSLFTFYLNAAGVCKCETTALQYKQLLKVVHGKCHVHNKGNVLAAAHQ